MQIREKLEVFRDFTIDVAKEKSSQLIAQYEQASQQELEEYRKNRQAELEHRIQLEEQKVRRQLNSKVSGELLRQKHMLVIIYINPSDADRKEELERETGAKLTISSIEFGGGIRAVIHSRNMLMDESFASRLEQEEIYL